jgi:hypothetical protein
MTIQQDWNPIRKVYQSLLDLKQANKLREEVNDSPTAHYRIGNHSSLLVDKKSTLNDWTSLSGEIVDINLKWINQARKLFSGLNFQGCAYNVTHIDLQLHVDIFPEEIKPVCKVNYIVSCEDPNAITLSQDADDATIFHSYPSVPRTAWLLDTGLPHEVKSQGCREILEFKFHNSYETLCEFFTQVGPIVFDESLNYNTL